MQRLWARAFLDDGQAALAHAEAEAATGDESWQQWVAEYRRGDALILNLELRVELTGGETVDASMNGVFVENHVDAPRVERQIAELASDVFAVLGKRLAEREHDIDARHLGEMYVHVELDSGVRRTPFRTPA